MKKVVGMNAIRGLIRRNRSEEAMHPTGFGQQDPHHQYPEGAL